MRLRALVLLLLSGAFFAAASGAAMAKVAAYRLSVEGPGMESPAVIGEGRLLDRASSVLLFRGGRARTSRPATPGPAYLLTYGFRVYDEDGNRMAAIRQTLYPFASGGPIPRWSQWPM